MNKLVNKYINGQNMYIKSANDLVTSLQQTRAGFISAALEKNRRATPFIQSAKSLKALASKAKTPQDLLEIHDIEPSLLTAAGISDKALNYFSEEDKIEAIKLLIKNFLEPAGEYFLDELVYRYLLIKGDSLGGQMRNIVGAISQQKLIRTLLSNMNVMSLSYKWLDGNSNIWHVKSDEDLGIEENLKAISWEYKGVKKLLAFNLSFPIIKKNVDICLFNADNTDYLKGKIVLSLEKVLMLGELKGGIDPAGADEHWKTASTALQRIRNGFLEKGIKIKTSFIGAAIATNMAAEIWSHLISGDLTYAANLTVDDQVVDFCNWIITQ